MSQFYCDRNAMICCNPTREPADSVLSDATQGNPSSPGLHPDTNYSIAHVRGLFRDLGGEFTASDIFHSSFLFCLLHFPSSLQG